MSIRIDTLTEQESIVVTTRGSVYELTILRGDRGEVLVRGGSQFPDFRQACLLGSIADDGLFGPRTIGVGLRMKFVSRHVRADLASPVVLTPQRLYRLDRVLRRPVRRVLPCENARTVCHHAPRGSTRGRGRPRARTTNPADLRRVQHESAFLQGQNRPVPRTGITFAFRPDQAQRIARSVTRYKEKVMLRRIAALVIAGISLGAGNASAQEPAGTPGSVEMTYMPVSAGYFVEKGDHRVSVTTDSARLSHSISTGSSASKRARTMLATTSDLQFGDLPSDVKAPNMLSYTGNVVLSPWTGHPLVPYATGGIGGLTMFERPALGIAGDETFLSGNVGGGVKWYAPNNRWGLRADYRFGATKSKDDAPEFFGRETRYAHRAYAAVVINTAR